VLEIVGNGAVLDGSLSLAEADWEVIGPDLYAVRPPKMSYQQFFLDGQPAERVAATGDKAPELAPRQWCLLSGRILFRTDPGRRPEGYNPSCTGHPVAITLYQVHDLVIRDQTIRGYQLDGVNAHDTVTRCDLVGINSSHNGRSGFSIGGASRVRLENCSAAGNGAAQVRTEGFSRTQILGGIFDEASAPALVQEGGQVATE
ncbi:MAG: right-handed parallel beta-helix repeat-containing protein, partial [Gammaproteobacteria bacterium]